MLLLLGYVIQLVSLLVAVFPKAVLKEISKIKVTTRLRLLEGTTWVLLGVAITWHTQSTKFPMGVLTVGVLSIGLGAVVIPTQKVWQRTIQSHAYSSHVCSSYYLYYGPYFRQKPWPCDASNSR